MKIIIFSDGLFTILTHIPKGYNYYTKTEELKTKWGGLINA